MKINWEKLVLFLKETIPSFLKSDLVPLILRTLGLAGGVWTWIVGIILSLVWKEAEQELESEARIEDQKEVDDSNIDKYKKDIKEGAPVETKIKDETNLLNGSDSN